MARTKRLSSFKWTPKNVSATKLPKMIVRNYYEQRDVRAVIERLPTRPVNAAEVGAGFGRLTLMLPDLCDVVTAFERESEMVGVAKVMMPWVNFVKVPSLTSLPASDLEFDFTMIFTVLQHIADKEAYKIIDELRRITSKYCLLVEDTDPDYHYKDKRDKTHFTNGRSIEEYSRLMEGFHLIHTQPRPMEPGYGYAGIPRPFVGDYMLFERRDEGQS